MIALALAALLGCSDPQGRAQPAPYPEPDCLPAPELPTPAADVALPPNLQEWRIEYGDLRKKLTQDYLLAHLGPESVVGDPEIDSRMTPRVIVLHWTGQGTVKSAWHTFAPERRKNRPDLEGAKALNISVHFIVGRDGVIYRLMDEDRIARHAIGLNHLSIGVENVGDGRRWPMTPEQVQANVDLVRYLKERFPSITHLVGHYETNAFEFAGHPYFIDLDTPRSEKNDPGRQFMADVRAGVADLGLEGAPEADMTQPLVCPPGGT